MAEMDSAALDLCSVLSYKGSRRGEGELQEEDAQKQKQLEEGSVMKRG